MANTYNSLPIIINTTMASGWKSLQTLNTGNLPTTIQNPVGIPRQFGFQIVKVVWEGRTVSQANSFTIVDPNDATVLLQDSVADGAATAPIQYDEVNGQKWRDFKCTGITSGNILIYYRA